MHRLFFSFLRYRRTGGNREPSIHGRQRGSRVHEGARTQRHRPELRVRRKHQGPAEVQYSDSDQNRYWQRVIDYWRELCTIFCRPIEHENIRPGRGGDHVNSSAGYSLFRVSFYIFRTLFFNEFASQHVSRTKALISVVLDHSKAFAL